MEETWSKTKGLFATVASPPVLFLLIFFLAPMAIIWAFSFGDNASLTTISVDGTLANYAHALKPLYLGIIAKSVWFAAADHLPVPGRRLPGGGGDHLRLGEDEGVAAAAGHAAVLDQSADPHLSP